MSRFVPSEETSLSALHFVLISFIPLVVDAEAGQSGDGLSLYQILQTDGTLSTVFTEHIRCKCTNTQINNQGFSRLKMALWGMAMHVTSPYIAKAMSLQKSECSSYYVQFDEKKFFDLIILKPT